MAQAEKCVCFCILGLVIAAISTGVVLIIIFTLGSTPEDPPSQILIQSEAGAAEYKGSDLGFYDIMLQLFNERPAYQQRGGPSYVYYHQYNSEWYVGEVLGGTTVSFRIQSNAHLPPTSGWKYGKNSPFSDGTWSDDDSSLRVTKNPVDVNWCSHPTVSSTGPAAAKYPSLMGVYSWTGDWLAGKKVYKNGNFYLTMSTGVIQWAIQDEKGIKGAGIVSGRGTVCPCSDYAGSSLKLGQDGWQYYDAEWKTDLSIKVTCD